MYLSGFDVYGTTGSFINGSHPNNNLINLSGLENLTSIPILIIHDNFNLVKLSSLEGLTSINYNLSLFSNNSLTSLSNLEGLTTIGALRLNDNPMLENCSIISVCNHIADGGTVIISGNAPGCNSIDEVVSCCDSIGAIKHPIFYDLNENGIFEKGEPFYLYASVKN